MNPALPEIVRQWVDDLPLINADKTRTLLAEALGEINSLDLVPENRYETLEMLVTPVACVKDTLKKSFLEKPIPLRDKHLLLANQTVDLCSQMATGYRTLVADLGHHGRQPLPLTIAIHRALRHLGEILLINYQLYIQYPAGLWKMINALYTLAERHDITDRSVSDTTLSTPAPSTISTVYKQILLLSQACPCRLRQKEIKFVHNALMDRADSARLYGIADSHAQGLFAIKLDSDTPPSYLQPGGGDISDRHWRRLDTLTMADRIRDTLDKQPRIPRRHTGIGDTDILQRLIRAWGAIPEHRFRRHHQSIRISLVIGLNAIHSRLTATDTVTAGTDDSIEDQHYLQDPTFEGETCRRLVTTGENQGSSSKPPAAPAEDWKMVNISAGGYRLLRDNPDSSNARVGELVAIIEQDNPAAGRLQPGVVRWMKCRDEYGLELGIQMLAPGAQAIRACLDEAGGRTGSRMQGILLPEVKPLKQPASLLLPTLPFRAGCVVALQTPGLPDNIRLTRQLENTGSFARYHFSAAVTG